MAGRIMDPGACGSYRRLHAIESLAAAAPVSLTNRCPRQQVDAEDSESHAQPPPERPKPAQGQAGKEEDADEGEPRAAFLDHLATAAPAGHHGSYPCS